MSDLDYQTFSHMTQPDSTSQKKPSLLINLAFNIIIPTLILTKLSGDGSVDGSWGLGIKWALIVALSFPLAYGLKDLIENGKVNFFSVLGMFGVLLNGSVGLLELDPKYIAIKEAAIPAIIGLVVLFSLRTKYPLIKVFLFNDQIIDTDRVDLALKEHHAEEQFNQRLTKATYMFAGSMLLSAILNYILAVVVVTAPAGSVEFNEQLGKMTALSFPVIALPVTAVMMYALFYLFRGVTQLTGLPLEDIMRADLSDDKKTDSLKSSDQETVKNKNT
jgi:hypothetical protein